jgi:hypothetical protein
MFMRHVRYLNDNESCNVSDDVRCFPAIFVAYAGHKFFSSGFKGYCTLSDLELHTQSLCKEWAHGFTKSKVLCYMAGIIF